MAPGHRAVNEAVALFLAAAETASPNGQFAPEVMCQTDVRLELQAIVECPRAAIEAHYAGLAWRRRC
jgi:hypothetical protein